MTREEEIQKAAEAYTQEIIDGTTFEMNYEEDNYDAGSFHATSEVCPMAFKDGAQWADEHPAKKQIITIDAWVARDKDGKLYAYKRPPYKNLDKGKFYPSGNLDDDGIVLEEFDAFPSVTFENSPKKVKVTIELEDER